VFPGHSQIDNIFSFEHWPFPLIGSGSF